MTRQLASGSLATPIAAAVVALALLAVPLAAGCAGTSGQSTAAGAATSSAQGTPTPSPTATVPSFGRVFMILMENKEYGEIIGADDAPYINQLAKTYGNATQYYAIRHPSLPNYLALASGSTQGMTTDCADCSFGPQTENLVDQLERHNRSWRAYMEDMPQPCFNGTSAGSHGILRRPLYVRRHNPWMYFQDISNNPSRCNQVVPLSQFNGDLQNNKLPDYVWITPNTIHDMHDGSVKDGDTWLSSFLPPILDSATFKDNGVIFLVWDEGEGDAGCCGDAMGGHTVALVIAANGKRGYQSSVPYTHYSVLRTVEESWQLGLLGGAADPGTQAMGDFFQ